MSDVNQSVRQTEQETEEENLFRSDKVERETPETDRPRDGEAPNGPVEEPARDPAAPRDVKDSGN